MLDISNTFLHFIALHFKWPHICMRVNISLGRLRTHLDPQLTLLEQKVANFTLWTKFSNEKLNEQIMIWYNKSACSSGTNFNAFQHNELLNLASKKEKNYESGQNYTQIKIFHWIWMDISFDGSHLLHDFNCYQVENQHHLFSLLSSSLSTSTLISFVMMGALNSIVVPMTIGNWPWAVGYLLLTIGKKLLNNSNSL